MHMTAALCVCRRTQGAKAVQRLLAWAARMVAVLRKIVRDALVMAIPAFGNA